jgi:hypothetical protein
MTTVETAKLIRQELATAYPGVKFSVRKHHAGVIWVEHANRDLTFRTQLDSFLRKFEGWNTYGTEFVHENPSL